MSYDNNMKGALFHNKDKKGEKHPDYSGECEINGVKLKIAGWRSTSKSGMAYISLKFSGQAPAQQPSSPSDIPDGAIPDEDLPF